MKLLEGKTAFVTGGGQGIGRGISLSLAKEGANVVVCQRRIEVAKNAAAEVETLGVGTSALALDVTRLSSVKEAVAAAIDRFGQIDILVNNAGIAEEVSSPTTSEDFDVCYQVNLKGAWTVSEEIIPQFKGRKEGKIVNIASVAGRRGISILPGYSASKAGMISLTQSQAQALGPFNVNVNAICPGTVKPAQSEKGQAELGGDPNFFESAANATMLKRIASCEDIGRATVFFASPLAVNITGQSLNVDGGVFVN